LIVNRPQKITFGEMREMGVRGFLASGQCFWMTAFAGAKIGPT
jgi:hypothetical protein